MFLPKSLAISILFLGITLSYTLHAPLYAQNLPPVPSHEEFISTLSKLKSQFVREGVSPAVFDDFLQSIQYREGIIESDRNQPESKFTLNRYLKVIVSKDRIALGKKMMKEHQNLLASVSAEYGVPAHVLVAFWGIESFYGKYTGKVDIPSALATLSFDKRRRTFFQKQLLFALRIISDGHITKEHMKGSWAGAMGQMQFIPSTYYQYAKDFDNDNKINLWHSLPDIFGSAGNYLKEVGWKKGERWGRAVRLPQTFRHNPKETKSVAAWKELGLTLWDGNPLPDSDLPARVVIYKEGDPAFLVYHNFDVILRWNRSNLYAIAVGLLSDHFAGVASIGVASIPQDFSKPF